MSDPSDSPLPPTTSFFTTVPGKVLAAVLVIALVAIGYIIFEKRVTGGSSDFSQNQKVTAQSILRFQFPETMDHESVEEDLSIPGDLTGELRWEGSALILPKNWRKEPSIPSN